MEVLGMPALRRFRCQGCGRVDAVSGGNDSYRCADCKPSLDPFTLAKRAAHKAVADARRAGQLRAPSEFTCTDCQEPAVEYDHRDYGQPLKVDPVCRRCNLRRGPAIGLQVSHPAASLPPAPRSVPVQAGEVQPSFE
jgi:hypothetical protein